MNLKDLKYIVTLAEYRHFSEAAKAVFISQPTLSMQIKKLEEDLGVVIFERSKREVLLTAAGSAIIEQAKIILQAAQTLETIADNFKDPFGGALRLGVFPTLAPYYLPHIVPKIKKAFPQLKLLLIEQKTQMLLDDLQSGALDAALIALPVTGKEGATLAAELIFEEPFFLAAPSNHVLAKKPKVSAVDLAQHEVLLLEEGHCLREQALQVCHRLQAHESLDFRATSLETLRQMIISNGSITLMPQLAIEKTNKQITYIPFMRPVPSRKIALVYRQSSTRKQLLEQLITILKNHLPL